MPIVRHLLWMFLCLLCCGCGPKGIHIDGTVTFDGEPIENGTIELLPIEGTGGPGTGASIDHGRYACLKDTGLVRGGKYRVRITAVAKTGTKMVAPPSPIAPNENPEGVDVFEQYIPAVYNVRSTLTAVLSSSSAKNTFDFQLQGKPVAK